MINTYYQVFIMERSSLLFAVMAFSILLSVEDKMEFLIEEIIEANKIKFVI